MLVRKKTVKENKIKQQAMNQSLSIRMKVLIVATVVLISMIKGECIEVG